MVLRGGVWSALVTPWCLCLVLASPAGGQGASAPSAPSSATVPKTVFEHSSESRFYVSGQVNVIWQAHGSFDAPYTGPHSLRPTAEDATSYVATLYTGVQFGRATEVLLHIESTGGKGLSDALGVAGFPNYDAVRNPSLSAKPYLARLLVHRVFRLGGEDVAAERDGMGLLTALPARRFELTAGKLCMADYLDTNGATGDSRFAFMNWTVNNNGAYDWAADTRGYTVGVVA